MLSWTEVFDCVMYLCLVVNNGTVIMHCADYDDNDCHHIAAAADDDDVDNLHLALTRRLLVMAG